MSATVSLFQIVFHHFDKFDDPCEVTLHGKSEIEAKEFAYQWSLKNGDGDYSIKTLRKVL